MNQASSQQERRVGKPSDLGAVALPILAIALIELFALAPPSAWVSPLVWLATVAGSLTVVLGLWILVKMGVAILRVVRLARWRDAVAPSVVVAFVSLGHLWPYAKSRLNSWLPLSERLVAAAFPVGLVAVYLLARWLADRLEVPPRDRRSIFIATLAATVFVAAGSQVIGASELSRAGALAIHGGTILYVLVVWTIAVLARTRRRVAVLVTLLAALALFRLATTNPHAVHVHPHRSAGKAVAGAPVLFIVFDTFRADAADLSDPSSSRTPNLARLAAEADVYEQCTANASWTLPGHTSLFTGRSIGEHGVDLTSEPGFRPKVPDTLLMVQELFAAQGYRTSGIAGNVIVGPNSRLSRGFQRYRHPGRTWMLSTLPIQLVHELSPGTRPQFEAQLMADIFRLKRMATAHEIVDLALDELEGDPAPIYLFLNFMDTHKPYLPPPGLGLGERLAFMRDEVLVLLGLQSERDFEIENMGAWRLYYDHGAAVLDREVGRLFDDLRARGWWDDMLVIVTSDHGEAFLENPDLPSYYGHHAAYEPVVRIPLMIKRPGQKQGAVFTHRVQQSDVLPAVLEIAGLPPVPGIDGSLSAAGPAGGGAPRTVITEWYPRPFHTGDASHPRYLPYTRVGIYRDAYKFVVEDDDREQLFDLGATPYEQRDILPREPDVAADLREDFTSSLAARESRGGDASDELDPAILDQLRALGYVR